MISLGMKMAFLSLLSKKKILRVVCVNEVDAIPEVVKWNSWDSEHLRTIHKAYIQPKVLFDGHAEGLFVDSFKIPFIPIRIKTMVFTAQVSESTQISYSLTPFFLAKNSINVQLIGPKKTKVEVKYEFESNIFFALFFPAVKLMIKKWNRVVWHEDLPLKLRRQKALDYGFIDFVGLPIKISERLDRSDCYKTEIPVIKSPGLIETSHPFYNNAN